MNNYWRYVFKRELVLGKEYVKFFEDELMMAVCFGWREPFMFRLMENAMGMEEVEEIMLLMDMRYAMRVEENGNLRIFNY